MIWNIVNALWVIVMITCIFLMFWLVNRLVKAIDAQKYKRTFKQDKDAKSRKTK